jgi:NodT family efflux transporter outer membrane factor (OMF) lipoprotein
MSSQRSGLGRQAVAAGLAIVTASCAVGPDYKRPAAPVPAAFKEAAAPPPEPGEWKPAEPRDTVSRGRWWEAFDDPVLNDLEEQATAANFMIVQAEAQYRAARAAARGALSGLFPSATVGGSATRSRSSGNRPTAFTGTSASPATLNDFRASLDATWELDVWGRIRRSVEANVATAQASAADLESARLSLHAELATDYFLLRGFDAQKKLLDTTVAAYEKALQLTMNRYNQGVVSGVDVAQAQTQLFSTRAQAVDLGLSRAQLEHAIAILVGKAPGDFEITPSPGGVMPPAIPAALPSELLERRPDVAASERRVASANAQVGVATAAFFPTLLLAATGGFEASSIAKWFHWPSRFWSLGASLVGTVFDGGKRKAATEQAVAFYDAAVAGYRQDVLTAFLEVEDNLAALRLLADEATLQADAAAAAERSLTLAQNRYQGGITSYLEVVTAQSTALANERLAVEIATRRMTASVNLVKALGGGWQATDLPAPGAVLARQETPPKGPS